MKLWRQGTRTPEWWLAAALGFGLIALDLTGQAHRGVADARVLYFLATMTVAVLVGLWAWAWRSPPRMGKLMYLWPVLVVMADLPERLSRLVASPRRSVLRRSCSGSSCSPRWRSRTRPGGSCRGAWRSSTSSSAAISPQVIQNVVNMLFWDNRACRPFCATPYAPTLIHVGSAPFSLETWNKAWTHLRHGHPADRAVPARPALLPGERRRPAVDRADPRDRHLHHRHVLDLRLCLPHGQVLGADSSLVVADQRPRSSER